MVWVKCPNWDVADADNGFLRVKDSDFLPRCSTASLLVKSAHGLNARRRPLSAAKQGLPPPLGCGVCETKSKNGRSRPRKPFISRVFCAQRASETMVSDHGLGRGQTMG